MELMISCIILLVISLVVIGGIVWFFRKKESESLLDEKEKERSENVYYEDNSGSDSENNTNSTSSIIEYLSDAEMKDAKALKYNPIIRDKSKIVSKFNVESDKLYKLNEKKISLKDVCIAIDNSRNMGLSDFKLKLYNHVGELESLIHYEAMEGRLSYNKKYLVGDYTADGPIRLFKIDQDDHLVMNDKLVKDFRFMPNIKYIRYWDNCDNTYIHVICPSIMKNKKDKQTK